MPMLNQIASVKHLRCVAARQERWTSSTTRMPCGEPRLPPHAPPPASISLQWQTGGCYALTAADIPVEIMLIMAALVRQTETSKSTMQKIERLLAEACLCLRPGTGSGTRTRRTVPLLWSPTPSTSTETLPAPTSRCAQLAQVSAGGRRQSAG